MEYLLLNKLQQRRNELKKIIRKTEASVKRAPDGILKYGRRKNTLDYYWKAPGAVRYRYIPKKNRKFAAALAQKSYDEKVLRLARQEEELICSVLARMILSFTPNAENVCALSRRS